jgi:hypothetical protein
MIDACSTGLFLDVNNNPNIQQGFVAPPAVLPFPEYWRPPAVSPALARFKLSWEEFIDSLLKEWKTFNLVSALLLSYAFLSLLN